MFLVINDCLILRLLKLDSSSIFNKSVFMLILSTDVVQLMEIFVLMKNTFKFWDSFSLIVLFLFLIL